MSFIRGSQIKSGAVEARHLKAGAVVAAALGAGSVDNSKLGAGSVSADKLQQNVLRVQTTILTNAEFLNLRATPKSLAPAAGAGQVHLLVSATLSSLASGGAYTETADNLAVKYTNGSGATASGVIETTGVIDGTTLAFSTANAVPCIPVANAALVLHNTGDGEFGGGNVANVMKLELVYRTVNI